jgi:hypothetical protein
VDDPRFLPAWRRLRGRIYLWPIMHLPIGTLDRPIESFIAVLCVIAGVTQLTGIGEQQSVDHSLPAALVYLWSVELIVGGVFVMFGVWRRDLSRERAGLLTLGAAALVYAICALAFLGSRSIYTVCITTAFAVAVGLRALVISLFLQLERALRVELQELSDRILRPDRSRSGE